MDNVLHVVCPVMDPWGRANGPVTSAFLSHAQCPINLALIVNARALGALLYVEEMGSVGLEN